MKIEEKIRVESNMYDGDAIVLYFTPSTDSEPLGRLEIPSREVSGLIAEMINKSVQASTGKHRDVAFKRITKPLRS